MSLIQELMPRWRLREIDHLAVRAEPDAAWRQVRSIDRDQLELARRLFALPRTPTAPGGGFRVLGENQHELVIGAIGRFWLSSIEFAGITPATFTTFDLNGWGKAAWSVTVAPRRGGAWIVIELRLDAGDDASWRRFQRYWRVIGPFSHAVRSGMFHHFARTLGVAAQAS